MKNSLLAGSATAVALALGVGTIPAANAASLTVNLTQFTGDSAGGEITITDSGTDIVDFLVKITSPTVNGDIRGVFFDVLGGTAGLTAVGADVAGLPYFNTCSGGGGNNLNGGGSPCPFDVVLDIAGPGGNSLITQTSFQVTRSGLSVASFLGQDFGLRYQQTGANQEGSSKLAGVAPTTPVPTPALLPGLIGMGVAALRKRKGVAEESTEA